MNDLGERQTIRQFPGREQEGTPFHSLIGDREILLQNPLGGVRILPPLQRPRVSATIACTGVRNFGVRQLAAAFLPASLVAGISLESAIPGPWNFPAPETVY